MNTVAGVGSPQLLTRRRTASSSARGDRLHDVRRVPADAGEKPGRHRVEEEESDEVQPWLVGDDAATMDRLDRLVFIAEDRQVDPGEVGPEPRTPDDVRRLEDAAVLEDGMPPRTPTTRGARSMPAAARSLGLTRTSGAPWERSFGRTLRPIGVPTVSTRWPMNRNSKGRKTNRAGCALDAEADMTASFPASQVGCCLTTSMAISPPEFPAPTTSTDPSSSCAGFRYSPEWSWTMPGSSWLANAGTRGTWSLPIATTTLSASKRRSPASTMKALPCLG